MPNCSFVAVTSWPGLGGSGAYDDPDVAYENRVCGDERDGDAFAFQLCVYGDILITAAGDTVFGWPIGRPPWRRLPWPSEMQIFPASPLGRRGCSAG